MRLALITFPTLLALGYPPVLSNVTNTIGVLPAFVFVFDSVVPILIIFACVLVIAAPRLEAWAAAREHKSGSTSGRKAGLILSTGLTGVYGGYFGAAQGVILISLLSVLLEGGMQKANAYKNVLAAFANGAAAVVFLFTTEVAWAAAGIIALGAILGGQIGGNIGRSIPPLVYRAIIVVIGLVAVTYFYLP